MTQMVTIPLDDVLKIICHGEETGMLSHNVYALLAPYLGELTDETLRAFADRVYTTEKAQALGLGQPQADLAYESLRRWRHRFAVEGAAAPVKAEAATAETAFNEPATGFVLECHIEHATEDDLARLLSGSLPGPSAELGNGVIVAVPEDAEEWVEIVGDTLSEGIVRIVKQASAEDYDWLWLHPEGPRHSV